MIDEKPLCMEDFDSLQEGSDYRKGKRDHSNCAECRLEFSDGSSIVVFGGPSGGKVRYDKFGNECG